MARTRPALVDSLRAFAKNFSQQLISKWLLGVGGILGVLALFIPPSGLKASFIPRTFWLPLIVASVIWSSFESFHRERVAKKKLEDLIDQIRYCLALTDVRAVPRLARIAGNPDRTGYQITFTLQNSSSFPLFIRLEGLTVTPDGQPSAPFEAFSELMGTIPPGNTRTFPGWYFGPNSPPVALTLAINAIYGVPTTDRNVTWGVTVRIGWDNVGGVASPPTSYWYTLVDGGHNFVE